MIGNKTFMEYLHIIKIPMLIYTAWAFIYNVIDLLWTGIIMLVMMCIGIHLSIIIYLYIGWVTVKKYNGDILTGGAAGMIGGLFTGVIASTVNIIKAIIVVIILTLFPTEVVGHEIAYYGLITGLFMVFVGSIIVGIISIIIGIIMGFISGLIGAAIAANLRRDN